MAVVWGVSGHQHGVYGPLGVPRRCQGCIGGLAGSVGTQGPEGYS